MPESKGRRYACLPKRDTNFDFALNISLHFLLVVVHVVLVFFRSFYLIPVTFTMTSSQPPTEELIPAVTMSVTFVFKVRYGLNSIIYRMIIQT